MQPDTVSDRGPAFARHETFAPRSGWLKKGFDKAMATNGDVFLREDAQVELGVGKNMARAIRYWCHAFRLLTDEPVPGERATRSVPTPLGIALLGEDGFDPFLEDAASLWYLHWQLTKGAALATSWHFAFTIFAEREFTTDSLEAALTSWVRTTYPTARAVDKSLHKDVMCLVRMYGEPVTGGAVTEDSIHCPLADLGLLRPGAEPRSYAFNTGAKPDLPARLVVATCLEYASLVAPGASTVALSRLLYDAGSPGMVFKLTESDLAAVIEKVTREERALSLTDTAGLVQLAFRGDPGVLAQRLVAGHYAHSRVGAGR